MGWQHAHKTRTQKKYGGGPSWLDLPLLLVVPVVHQKILRISQQSASGVALWSNGHTHVKIV